MKAYTLPRRIGRFSIPGHMAATYDSRVLRIMGRCIVLRAEHLFHSDRLEITAVSDMFRPIEEGEIAPWYDWIISDTEGLACVERKT